MQRCSSPRQRRFNLLTGVSRGGNEKNSCLPKCDDVYFAPAYDKGRHLPSRYKDEEEMQVVRITLQHSTGFLYFTVNHSKHINMMLYIYIKECKVSIFSRYYLYTSCELVNYIIKISFYCTCVTTVVVNKTARFKFSPLTHFAFVTHCVKLYTS
jgi:hypothetical protein